jgi:hypothetical protein
VLTPQEWRPATKIIAGIGVQEMTKRRKPIVSLKPLEIVDDRNQADEAWIPARLLPPEKPYYGMSETMLVCRCLIPGHSRMALARYCFSRRQWRTVTGVESRTVTGVESEMTNVTHWQPLPDYPRSIDHE